MKDDHEVTARHIVSQWDASWGGVLLNGEEDALVSAIAAALREAMKDEAERSAYDQGQEDGYSKGWAAGNEHEDALDAEIAKLKAERDAAIVRGLERAKEIIAERRKTEGYVFAEHCGILDISDAIQAEIDKAKGAK